MLMIPLERFPHVHSTDTIREAIKVIHGGFTSGANFGFRNALVIDEKGAILGTVSMTVLLHGLEPKRRALPDRSIEGVVVDDSAAMALFWDRIFSGEFSEAVKKPVREIARPISATVAPGDPLSRALQIMLAQDVPLLPVVDGVRVLGVIRLVDIFNLIADLLQKER